MASPGLASTRRSSGIPSSEARRWRAAVVIVCGLAMIAMQPAGARSGRIVRTELGDRLAPPFADLQPLSLPDGSDLLFGKTDLGETRNVEPSRGRRVEDEKKKELPSTFRVAIAPAASQPSGLFPEPGRINAEGLKWMGLITLAYQTPFHRVISRVPHQAGHYDVSVVLSEGHEDLLYSVFQQKVKKALGIRLHREICEMDVFVLRTQEGKPSKLRRSRAERTQHWFDLGKIHGEKQTMADMTEVLEDLLDRPVVDETELEGEYDWELSYRRADEASVMEAIQEDLGLEIIPARRSVEVLVVEADDSSD